MKILWIHNEYARFSGEEAYFYQGVDSLRNAGHEVRTFVASSAQIPSGLRGKAGAFVSGIWSLGARRRLASLLQEWRPEVVQLQNLFPLISTSVLDPIAESGAALVYSAHNFRLFCPTGLMMRNGEFCDLCTRVGEIGAIAHNCEGSLARSIGYALRGQVARSRLLRSLDAITVISSFHHGVLFRAGVEEPLLHIVPNMTPRGVASIPDLPGTERPAARVVGYVGRLSPEKGIGIILACAELMRDVRFLLAGRLSEKIQLGRIPENVVLLGEVPREKLAEVYRQMDLLVVPSLCHEGLPTSALEAMALGIPVIASRSGGLMDLIVDGETGLLIPMHDPAALNRAVARLLDDGTLRARIKAQAMARLVKEYGEDTWVRRIEGAYRQAMDRRAGRCDRSTT